MQKLSWKEATTIRDPRRAEVAALDWAERERESPEQNSEGK